MGLHVLHPPGEHDSKNDQNRYCADIDQHLRHRKKSGFQQNIKPGHAKERQNQKERCMEQILGGDYHDRREDHDGTEKEEEK